MVQDRPGPEEQSLYLLTTGEPVASLSPFASPVEEYLAAFADADSPFLNYYTVAAGGEVHKRALTRGEFLELTRSAAVRLRRLGLSRGDRMVHCFSGNSLYDLAFRLAGTFTGCVPVTINWQADDDDFVLYKAQVTEARLVIYDRGFAARAQELWRRLPRALFLEAESIEEKIPSPEPAYPPLGYDDEKMVIFSSGTTGKPKGASLPHRSYLANRLTFESFLGVTGETRLDLLLVNPLHHTNSSALADWATRRPGTVLNLVQRYTTPYWKILTEAAGRKRDLLVTSIVARHIDFLESLAGSAGLPVAEAELKKALRETEILIGSAPVGRTTIERLLRFAGRVPHVRFGSTETCLQVLGIPATLPQPDVLGAFEAGWTHRYRDEEAVGYYIGREHFPFTRLKVMKAIDPASAGYFRPCEVGEPGYLITQGANLMNHYVGDPAATMAVFREGWYTGLRDIVFTLRNEKDGQLDYYWMSRDSALLVRGGANYAYEQVAAELSGFLAGRFGLEREQFYLAVVGIRWQSEHEDSCCVTLELNGAVREMETVLRDRFLAEARTEVSKGARPDFLRFAAVPRSFKGAVLYPQLKEEFLAFLKNTEKRDPCG